MSKSSERITEKRTVITSSSSAYDDGDDSIYYKSGITPRASTVVARSSVGPGLRASVGGGSGGTVYTRTVEYGMGRSAGMGNLSPGSFEKVSNTGVQNVKSTREREKKDMQDLNERFANYIEKVRFLEAQNRKLAGELEHLKTKWGKETSAIKSMYEQELAEARKLIDDITRDKNKLEIQNSSLTEEMNNLRRQMDDLKKYHSIDQEQINKLNQQVSDYEAEINMLRRTISSLETERARDKDRINKLQGEVDKLRIDLNNETLNHLDAENRRQSLEEEMEFLKKVHEQELKELAALAYRDTTEENREFWKSELSQAIRDIQSEYDNKVDQLRGDMESYYNLKVQEFRTGATKQNMEVTHVKEENKKLVKNISDLKGRLVDLEARNAQLESQYNSLLREYESIQSEHTMETVKLKEEITSLRAEMEAILVELQTLMDAKLSLELEIAAYRKLLECEESRVERLRRLGINVRNMRSTFRESPVEYKPEPSYEYNGNATVDDEQTEKDITPDEEMHIDIEKQTDQTKDDIMESKSPEQDVDIKTYTKLDTNPKEVRETEVMSSQASNVTLSSPLHESHGRDKGDNTKSEEKLTSAELTTGNANTDSHDTVDDTMEAKEVNTTDTKPEQAETHKETDDIKPESISVENDPVSKDSVDRKEVVKEEIQHVKSEVKETTEIEENKEITVGVNGTQDNTQNASDPNIENQSTEAPTSNGSGDTKTETPTDQTTDVGSANENQNKTEPEVKQDEGMSDYQTDPGANQKSVSDDVNISNPENSLEDTKQMIPTEESDKNAPEDSKTQEISVDDTKQESPDDRNKSITEDDEQKNKHTDDIKPVSLETDTNQGRQPNDNRFEEEKDKEKPIQHKDDTNKKLEDTNSQSDETGQNVEEQEDSTKSGDSGSKDVETKSINDTNKPNENIETGDKSVDSMERKADSNKVLINGNGHLTDKTDIINGDDDGTTSGNGDEQDRIRGAGYYRRYNDENYPIDMIDTVEVENPNSSDSVHHEPETRHSDEPPDYDNNPEDSHSSMKMMRGEVSAKTTYQKTSTGPVSISEVNQDGKHITLENTSSQRREVNLDGWKIRRELDNDREIVYTFRNFTLKPHKSVKIVARGAASEAGINDLVFRDEDSWGVGSEVNTTLVNEKGEEKATHRQRVNYN